jgi:hypothetical protein
MSGLYTTISPTFARVVGGQSVQLTLSITNTSTLIDAYSVRIFGLDAAWFQTRPERLSLFPLDTENIELELFIPADFPAGTRQISVHIQSENDQSDFAFGTVTLQIADRPLVGMTVDPVSINGGSTAQFGLVVTNNGNSALDVTTEAVDPEEESEFRFEPPTIHLLPGEQHVVRASVRARRPWIGAPKVRVLTFRAAGVNKAEALGTFVQRPRIGRWVISLLGLLTAASVFAAVISRTLDNVVKEAKLDPSVVNAALDKAAADSKTVSLKPASITGSVVSASTGKGVSGVQAVLYDSGNGTTPIASAATADDGSYAFAKLSAGTYRLKFTGAGFTDLWYTSGRVFAEASDIKVEVSKALELAPMVFGGRPGSVSGKVIAADPVGTTITLVRQGLADPAVPAVVAKVQAGADGSFVLANVPSPASYQLIAERVGSATETRSIHIDAGDSVEGINIFLRPGDGVVSGLISTNGQALGGVTVSASDGTNIVQTVSLTDGKIGTYALRSLATPGVYTITVSRDGYEPETRTIRLAAHGTAAADWSLSPSIGSISGQILDASGAPLGGVIVSLSGPSLSLTARSLSVPMTDGTVAGSYRFDSLPAPGTYTLTFDRDGFVGQVRLVDIGSGSRSSATGIDIVLSSSKTVIRGTVSDVAGHPVALSTVTLTDGISTRRLVTAHDPLGQYTFSNVTPGTYTLTASLTGAAPVVQLVSVQAGTVTTVDLRLGRQASLSGLVVLNDHVSPAVGYNVRIFLSSQFPVGAAVLTTTTDSTGHYTFADVNAPEDYIVAVYPTSTSTNALDVILVTSIPGVDTSVGVLIGA